MWYWKAIRLEMQITIWKKIICNLQLLISQKKRNENVYQNFLGHNQQSIGIMASTELFVLFYFYNFFYVFEFKFVNVSRAGAKWWWVILASKSQEIDSTRRMDERNWYFLPAKCHKKLLQLWYHCSRAKSRSQASWINNWSSEGLTRG